MGEGVEKALEELVRAVRADERFIRYNEAKEAVAADAELSARVKEFTEARAENSEEYNERRRLSHKYWQLMLNGDANDFLTYEKAAAEALFGIFERLREAAGVETDFYV